MSINALLKSSTIILSILSAIQSQELTASQILTRVDDVLYTAKDKEMSITFILIDKNGKENVREMTALEKGADYRLMKFTAPADQKGISFLSLPDDVMYVYLPAFGKTRRIASHVKNTNFAGSDLTYENLEAKRYSTLWTPEIIRSDAGKWVLKLTPMPGKVSNYSKLQVTVRADNFTAVRIEYFDKSGQPVKTMTREKQEKVGNYWECTETIMEDLKTGHKTKLILSNIKHDTNLSNEKFTERYMMR